MSQATEIEADFAAAMQELSAQAADASPGRSGEGAMLRAALGISALISAVHSLGQRVEALEESVMQKLRGDCISRKWRSRSRRSATRRASISSSSIRCIEELISYRDNFVRESLQKPFIRDLLVLFDDLSGFAGQIRAGRQRKKRAGRTMRRRATISTTCSFSGRNPASAGGERNRAEGRWSIAPSSGGQLRAGRLRGRRRPHRDAGQTWFHLARSGSATRKKWSRSASVNASARRRARVRAPKIFVRDSNSGGMKTALRGDAVQATEFKEPFQTHEQSKSSRN